MDTQLGSRSVARLVVVKEPLRVRGGSPSSRIITASLVGVVWRRTKGLTAKLGDCHVQGEDLAHHRLAILDARRNASPFLGGGFNREALLS